MAISFIDGSLIVEQIYDIIIPNPLDISLPSIPGIPSFDFPEPPDLLEELNNLLQQVEDFIDRQSLTNIPPIAYDGSLDLVSGEINSVSLELPNSKIDIDSFKQNLIDNFPSLPSLPSVPSFDFPDIPNPADELLKLKDSFDFLSGLQSGTNIPPLSFNGANSLIPPDLPEAPDFPSFSDELIIPSVNLDFENILQEIDIGIPQIPSVPSFDFPEVPNPSEIFGDLGVDPDKYLSTMNDPNFPEYGYDPNSPTVIVKVFVNGVEFL